MASINLATESFQAYVPKSDWSALRLRRKSYQRILILSSYINFFYFWEKRWLFVAFSVGFALLQLNTPNGLSEEGMIVLTMSVIATILFITEPIPLPTVALLIIVGQVILLALPSTLVAKSLMTDSVTRFFETFPNTSYYYRKV